MSKETAVAKPTLAETRAERDALARQVAALEAENARLQSAAAAQRGPRRFSWRSLSSALLITVASILVPVSIVAGWARLELVDEATFVSTFAPLASDPDVQAAVTDAAVAAIEEQFDPAEVTDALFDGLAQLGLPTASDNALSVLRAPAAEGLRLLLRDGVERVVVSDAFVEVWTSALRTAHRALSATVATPSPDAAIVIDRSGQVILQLAPIIREVGARLAEQGLPLAGQLPAIEASIVVAQSDALALVRTVHTLTTALGAWLPVLTLGLLAAGIAVARSRRAAITGAGVGLALGAEAFLLASLVGVAVAVPEAVRAGLPGPAVTAIADQLLDGMRQTAADLLLIGVLTVLIAVLTGRPRVREAVAGMNARLAAVLGVVRWHRHAPVRFVAQQRVLIDVALIAGVLVALWLLPLHALGIVLVVLAGLLLWWLAAIIRSAGA